MVDAPPLEMHKIAHYLFYLDGIVDLLNAFIADVGHGRGLKMKDERVKDERRKDLKRIRSRPKTRALHKVKDE